MIINNPNEEHRIYENFQKLVYFWKRLKLKFVLASLISKWKISKIIWNIRQDTWLISLQASYVHLTILFTHAANSRWVSTRKTWERTPCCVPVRVVNDMISERPAITGAVLNFHDNNKNQTWIIELQVIHWNA